MNKEEKQLLLVDLCARLPYGVMCKIQTCFVFEDGTLRRGSYDKILDLDTVTEINEWKETGELEKFKPYLRPMSSMTEEELNECVCQSGIKDIECPNWQDIPKEKQFKVRLNHAIAVFLTDSNNVDWLNAHHFDYRGLIEKGLALEAPKGMYKGE